MLNRKTGLRMCVLTALVVLVGCEMTIHQAVRNNNYDKVKQMLNDDPSLINTLEQSKEAGGAKDRNARVGWTPLHWAASRNNPRISKLLLEHDADTRAKDPAGWTPLDESMKVGALKVEKMIRDAEKK